jgi:aminoglycoside 6'-N-acetyltransferase
VARRWRGDDLETEWAERLTDGESHPLTIRDGSGRIVGYVQFAEEDDPDYRHASIDIFIDPAQHRRGYATETLTVLVDHLFEARGHHRLTIDPAADNLAAIDCYAGVGFQPVGVLRRYERQADGTWADGLFMELLDTDPRPRPSS